MPFEPADELCYCRLMPLASDKLDADDVALFLDVDGTLLPIRDNPADVIACDALIRTLEQVFERLDGAMALVSGRSIADVDRIFTPAVFPVAGAHGAELRRSNRGGVAATDVALPQNVLTSMEEFAARHDGLLLEYKPGGVSLHYRRAPALESACRNLMNQCLDVLGDEFRLIAGKMVFEIAPGSHNKGAAIRSFLEGRPFAGRRPVFVGDDVTDEDGFRIVNDLGGVSIRVGGTARSEARYQLPAVADVRPWLRNAILAQQSNMPNGGSRT